MVSIVITTFNSASVIRACLESVKKQELRDLEIIVVDNASTDGTREILTEYRNRARIIFNESNEGFSGAQNQAMRISAGAWILSLNPDVILGPEFIANLVRAGEVDQRIGTVCGKLLRWNPGNPDELSRTIDSAGIYFLPNLRHLDRGSGELDWGQYDKSELVVGATGAAALYRRNLIDDISVNNEFFDEQFFAYREDADVAWRSQLMGWRCLYTPDAVAWHQRRVTPDKFKQLPHEINWHSIKNRFLMRAKNISAPLYARCFFPTLLRDAQIVAYCLLVDRKLASALLEIWKSRDQVRLKRRMIQSRRRVSDKELAFWFSRRPAAVALENSALKQ